MKGLLVTRFFGLVALSAVLGGYLRRLAQKRKQSGSPKPTSGVEFIRRLLNGEMQLQISEFNCVERWTATERIWISQGHATLKCSLNSGLSIEATGALGPTPCITFTDESGREFMQCDQPAPVGVMAPPMHWKGMLPNGAAVFGWIRQSNIRTHHHYTSTCSISALNSRIETIEASHVRVEGTMKYILLHPPIDWDCIAEKHLHVPYVDDELGVVTKIIQFDLNSVICSVFGEEDGKIWLKLSCLNQQDLTTFERAFTDALTAVSGELIKIRGNVVLAATEYITTIDDLNNRTEIVRSVAHPVQIRMNNGIDQHILFQDLAMYFLDDTLRLSKLIRTTIGCAGAYINSRGAVLGACIEAVSRNINEITDMSEDDQTNFSEFADQIVSELMKIDEIKKDARFNRVKTLIFQGKTKAIRDRIIQAANVAGVTLHPSSTQKNLSRAPEDYILEELESWNVVRNPAAHGHVSDWTQTELNHFYRCVAFFYNLALAGIGYQGHYGVNGSHMLVSKRAEESLLRQAVKATPQNTSASDHRK